MIVDIENLSVDYSGIKALDNLSFGIDEGDFLGTSMQSCLLFIMTNMMTR